MSQISSSENHEIKPSHSQTIGFIKKAHEKKIVVLYPIMEIGIIIVLFTLPQKHAFENKKIRDF